jgi:hypothetical protein
MDPRMGGQPADARRERTWIEEFRHSGLQCEAADSSDVGRGLFDEYLRPDTETRRPRAFVHPRCTKTILQMKRFMWEDWKPSLDKGQKQKPKAKYDDYPACWRYVMNARPDFDLLLFGYRTISASRRTGSRGRARGRSHRWSRTRRAG